MKSNPKWVLFDVGGVIFDYKNAFKNISTHLGISEEQLGENIYLYLGQGELGEMTFEQLWQNILASLNKKAEQEKVLSLWWNKDNWIKDTKSLIQELNKEGYLLALFTNNWSGMGDKILNEVPGFSVFSKVFESSKEGLCKPDVKFYQLIEEKLQVQGEKIYFIDDSPKNIEIAKQRNWQTFLYELGNDDGITSNNLIRRDLIS